MSLFCNVDQISNYKQTFTLLVKDIKLASTFNNNLSDAKIISAYK